MKLGVLALQGDFREHIKAIRNCGYEALEVKTPGDLEQISGLIVPGGESTTIGRLLVNSGLSLIQNSRMPIYGTCAGCILLAKQVIGDTTHLLGMMDITVERNAYGRQAESFEQSFKIPVLGNQPYNCVFIRAPVITGIGESVEILAGADSNIIMAKQGNLLATTFHPELTDDLRLHQYFISLCKGWNEQKVTKSVRRF